MPSRLIKCGMRLEKKLEIREYAEKELKRMEEVFSKVKIIGKSERAREFMDFAKNYFNDGKYFLKEGKPAEAFEAFIISWAYIDISLKLSLVKVPKEIQKFFTA